MRKMFSSGSVKKDTDAKKGGEKQEEKPIKVNIPAPPPPTIPAPDSESEKVGLAVTATKAQDGDVLVHVSAQVAPGAIRTPLDICCVVDVSGSMSSAASIKDGAGKEEKHGLSVLDVVKHAVKTIVHALEPYDRVAVVAFESSAKVAFPLKNVTAANKEEAIKKVDEMHPSGGTNLWGGLEKGMELLRENEDRTTRFPALFVLTDGMPDTDPKELLKKYKDSHPLPAISTFGFGYSVVTPILLNIASEGNGMHAFIPDASFVGTAFVNAISNLMVTVADNVTLSIEPENGATIKEVYGNPHQLLDWGARITLGSLQYGQTRDVVVRLSLPTPGEEGAETQAQPFVRATLKFNRAVGKGTEEVLESQCAQTDNGGVALEVQRARLLLAGAMADLIELGSKDEAKAQAEREALHAQVVTVADPRAQGIAQDLAGQVKEALQRTGGKEDFYQKWGRHYLPSLARAHMLQQCNNFKDPGIQFYGGKLFQELRDKIEDIFVKLPPPKPSIAPRAYGGGGGNAAPLASMRTYYNAGGGCIAGECVVRMADGTQKRVRDMVRGDRVAASASDASESAEVVCVVETRCRDGRESLVTLPGGLRLTPYHPVFVQGEWKFPIDLATPEQSAECEAVFNFVLKGTKMVINDVECITLGHGLEGEVAGHPYFGTQRVVDDLRTLRGWDAGHVVLRAGADSAMVRDAKTNLVCGFKAGADAVTVNAREL